MHKKIPNPDGKKGGQKHQEKVAEVAGGMDRRGLIVGFEFYFKVFDGIKNRFADLVGRDKATRELTEIHQVGKQNKNGTPVKREREAIEDIEKSQPVKVTFHPYNLIALFFAGLYLIYSYLS